MTRHRIGYTENHGRPPRSGRIVYDPRIIADQSPIWPPADTPRAPAPRRTTRTLRRHRSWTDRATDARWAIEDVATAMQALCRGNARTIDRAVFGVAILTVTLIVARTAIHLIERAG